MTGEAAEFYTLANDLAQVGRKAVPAMREVMADMGTALANEWRANAVATSGVHGKHYPNSIESDLAFTVSTIAVDVGPVARRGNQGAMGRGFEFGSRNQPPHLDGLRALDVVAPRAERAVDVAMAFLFR